SDRRLTNQRDGEHGEQSEHDQAGDEQLRPRERSRPARSRPDHDGRRRVLRSHPGSSLTRSTGTGAAATPGLWAEPTDEVKGERMQFWPAAAWSDHRSSTTRNLSGNDYTHEREAPRLRRGAQVAGLGGPARGPPSN